MKRQEVPLSQDARFVVGRIAIEFNMTEFGRRLKAVIREKGLSQTQVCSMTGKSKASISQYLSGTQLPPEKTQTEIAVALGLDVDYFNPQPVISQDETGDEPDSGTETDHQNFSGRSGRAYEGKPTDNP